ncbi:MAG: transposase [Allobaculum sp.]|nr:transposase [Allobaculum sp.]
MLEFLIYFLNSFKSCFRNECSFHNFIFCVLAIIASPCPDGISSLIRALSLKPSCYDKLQNFFKRSQWNLDKMNFILIQLVLQFAPLWSVNGHLVLVGDGCKVPTDAYKFPAISKEFIESESASKPNGYIKALNFAALIFLGFHNGHFFPLPIWARIVAGNKEILEWQGLERHTQPAQMALDALKVLSQVRKSILLVLDRFYLSKALLDPVFEHNQSHKEKLHVLVRAKNNLKVWTFHSTDPNEKRGRGRPKKRDFYSLFQAFEDYKDQFEKTVVSWNGRKVKVEILCLDHFLWGDLENPYHLRFVLVKSPKGTSIFATTDFTLTGQEAVETYALRFQIEMCFKTQKEMFGGFNGRFTCQALEKFHLKTKKGSPSPASRVKKKDRKKVIETYQAHERYVLIAMIAQCFCEVCRIKDQSEPSQRRIYQRTYGQIQSLGEMKNYLGDQIKTKIWIEPENWLKEILEPQITDIYPTKEMILISSERRRMVRRCC